MKAATRLDEDEEPIKLHNLINCRRFAMDVWTDKLLLKVDLTFDAESLHEILHINALLYYDACPGIAVVRRWFKEFTKEVC